MEVTVKQNTEVSASDILVAVLVNLKMISGKKQLFLKTYSSDFQNNFLEILSGLFFIFNNKFTKEYFVYHNSDLIPFGRSLQEAIDVLIFAGMINWPDIQEPDLMRLNPSAEDYYEKVLAANVEKRLSLQDIKGIQQIAKEINEHWPELIVDRPHFMI